MFLSKLFWKNSSSSWLTCRMYFFPSLHEASNSQSYNQTVSPHSNLTTLIWPSPSHLHTVDNLPVLGLWVSVWFITIFPCHIVVYKLGFFFFFFWIAHPCMPLSTNFHLISKIEDLRWNVSLTVFASTLCKMTWLWAPALFLHLKRKH